MNSEISDTSDDASGRADCATSAGFIGGILSTLYLMFEHDLFGKPVPTFPDHALSPILRERWLPVSTAALPGAAISASARASLVSHGGPVQSRVLLPLPTCQ